jgi:putative hydrolase of the HAD superfamily
MAARPHPKAILFDAGNTLVFADRERIFEIYRGAGVEPDEARFIRAELDARAELARTVMEGATGTEAHVWERYFISLFRGSGVPDDRLQPVGRKLQEAHAASHLWTLVEPGTAEALEALLDAGHRLGVISNADGRVEAVLEAVGLRRHLEFVVDSALVGVEKPDPRIFEEGLRRMAIPAEECLYVGDLYPVDVLGAQRVGMQALLLDPAGDLPWPADRIPSVTALPDWLRAQGG